MNRHLLTLFFILLIAISVLYLIPGFSLEYKNQRYTFSNYPSLINKSYDNIKVNIPGITETYITSIESVNQISNDNEWSQLLSRDQKTLEHRLEAVYGNAYELRLDKKDNKARFTIKSDDIVFDDKLLTTSNSVFEIYSVNTAAASINPNSQSEPTKTVLNLQRDDFGFAEVVTTASNSPQSQHSVRIPLGLLMGPNKIKLIGDNLFAQLSITTSYGEYSGKFDYNQSGTATHLVITGINSKSEAQYLRSLLNTPSYKLSYTSLGSEFNTTGKKLLLGLTALILASFVFAAILNRYTVNNLSIRKVLLMTGLILIYFGVVKLFAFELTLALLILLSIIIIFTLFNTRFEYYIALLTILFLLKLLGFLPGFEINIWNLLILSLFTLFIWTTNYVQKHDKKLA